MRRILKCRRDSSIERYLIVAIFFRSRYNFDVSNLKHVTSIGPYQFMMKILNMYVFMFISVFDATVQTFIVVLSILWSEYRNFCVIQGITHTHWHHKIDIVQYLYTIEKRNVKVIPCIVCLCLQYIEVADCQSHTRTLVQFIPQLFNILTTKVFSYALGVFVTD